MESTEKSLSLVIETPIEEITPSEIKWNKEEFQKYVATALKRFPKQQKKQSQDCFIAWFLKIRKSRFRSKNKKLPPGITKRQKKRFVRF